MFHAAHEFVSHLKEKCLELTESGNPTGLDGNAILKVFLHIQFQLNFVKF